MLDRENKYNNYYVHFIMVVNFRKCNLYHGNFKLFKPIVPYEQ